MSNKPPQTARVKGESALPATARRLRSQILRNEAIAEKATALADEAHEDLERLHRETEKKLRVKLPDDALLLDVLDLVEVQPRARWIWHGTRNNYGLATVRVSNSEQSLVRLLAVAFGVIDADEHGVLYPRNGDTDDVNPKHRVLRAAPTSVGNRDRFSYKRETK